MKSLVASLFFFCIFQSASSYPIDPRPLRKLVMESEYIVVGHVIEIVGVSDNDDAYSHTFVRIKVVNVLQGRIAEEVIDVNFEAGMICPAPPRYEVGKDVIVFLDKEESGYGTHALSYGAKILSLAAIEVYKQRITEIQAILKIEDKDQQFIQTVEWLVKCAEQPATRWEGTYELSRESDFMSYYARSEKEPFKYYLTDDQKMRLKNVLLQSDKPGYADLGLVDLVYPGNETEVYQYLLRSLKSLDERKIWMADAYMRRMIYAKNDPNLKKLCEEFEEIQFADKKDKERREIVNNFLALAEN